MGSILSRIPAIEKRTACILFSAISGGIVYFGRDLGDSFLKFLHLGCFSTWYGMHVWVFLVSGLVMFRIIPRRLFGVVQSKLLQKYYMIGAGVLSTSLATYIAENPINSWSGNRKFEGLLLASTLACNLTGFLVIEPLASEQMFRLHKYEKEHGDDGQEVGVRISASMKGDKEYMKIRKKFAKFHGMASLMNMTSLVTSVAYIWQLQKKFSL